MISKTICILLISLLTLFVAIVGGNQQVAAAEREYSQPNISDSFNFSTGPSKDILINSGPYQFLNGFLSIHRGLITPFNIKEAPPYNRLAIAFLLETNPQPYWLRNPQSSGSFNFIRTTTVTKLQTANNYRLSRYFTQSEMYIPSNFSSLLQESSPPGFFLLI
jgi:hypothetical protein